MRRAVELLGIFRVLFMAGATTFGGMWAATDKLERDLVERTGWLPREELRASFVLATPIPAPRFLGFGALVGYQVGGWPGSFPGLWGCCCPPRCSSSPAPSSSARSCSPGHWSR